MHFVKHSLLVAMLAILTGCGGSSNSTAPMVTTPDTPVENLTVVTDISPKNAVIGQVTTFTLTGSNMNGQLQVSLPSCLNISALKGTTTSVSFTCTPQAEGTPILTVKTAAGVSAFTSEIKFQATGTVGNITISRVDMPSKVTVGQQASFTITGQNLPETLQIGVEECQNTTQTNSSATEITFTCTPRTAGTQRIIILSPEGVSLYSGSVLVQSPPPLLTGTWRQTTANGCTGTIEGETVAGARSKKPLFTFVKNDTAAVNSDARLRLISNEGFAYTTTDCTDTSNITTGIARDTAIFDNVGAVQQTSGLNYYYPVDTVYRATQPALPAATAIVFKNTDTFCLFDGAATAANINQFIQNVDLTTSSCFARSAELPFSQIAPATLLTQSTSQLLQRPDDALTLAILERLNQRGQSRYVLLREAKLLQHILSSSNNTTGPKTYDLFTQIAGFSDLTFSYQTLDEPSQDTNFEINRLKQLNDLGSQSWLFLGKKQLDAFFGAKTLYAKNNLSQTFSYEMRNDSDVNATKLISILDAQGASGCRFIDMRLKANTTNTQTTVCVNSSRNNGAFSYRYVAYPTDATRADALKALLDGQKLEGFYPIRVWSLTAGDTPRILFERDSSIGAGIQGMQYKVYSQSLPSNQPELANLLNDQGKLGWHFWSQINDPTGKPLATIFSSLPFPQLPDGEAVVLDRR